MKKSFLWKIEAPFCCVMDQTLIVLRPQYTIQCIVTITQTSLTFSLYSNVPVLCTNHLKDTPSPLTALALNDYGWHQRGAVEHCCKYLSLLLACGGIIKADIHKKENKVGGVVIYPYVSIPAGALSAPLS